MTIRDLITMGVGIDMEICVEARTYDEDGNRTGTYYSFSGIEQDDFEINGDTLIIKADVNSVI